MKNIIILLLAVIMFTACERKSGKLDSINKKIEYNELTKIKIIGLSSTTYVEGIKLYEHKAIKLDSSIVYVRLNHVFNYGEVLVVKQYQIVTN